MGDDHPTIPSLSAVVDLPWVQDAITPLENKAIQRISWLHFRRASTAYDVINMPFLADFDTADALALMAMYRLDAREDAAFLALTEHSIFQDGITDDETTLIAALGTFRNIRRLLEPDALKIETVALGTELTPDLKISIVRATSSRNQRTSGTIRDVVEFIESKMGLPLPVDHVIVVAHDWAVTRGSAALNYGFAISMLRDHERNVGIQTRGRPERLIAHEVAHYFWRGNEGWINEGIAEGVFEFLYGGANLGLSGVGASRPDGCNANNIIEAEDYSCNYYLGGTLFRGLHNRMGAAAFFASLRELYRVSWSVDGSGAGIDEVRQAFCGQLDYIDSRYGTSSPPHLCP